MTSAQDIADYLNGLPDTDAVPVVVKIGRTEHVGAVYTQKRATLPGCRAYEEGERHYFQHAIYLLGKLPPAYVRSRRVAFRFDDGRRRWYVAGWYPFEQDGRKNEYHPFGAMFQLMPDHHDVTSDEKGPYPERTMRLVQW